MRKGIHSAVFAGIAILAIGTVTGCENREEATGLEEIEAAIAPAGAAGFEGHLDGLRETLDLTDAQVGELRAIFEERHDELRALHEGTAQDHEARHAELREEMLDLHERIRAVLTEEQGQRLDAYARSRHGSGGSHGAGHGGG